MLPDKPEDWPRVFEQHLNAGDLDAVMALYESEARFVTKSGETLIGRDRIRKVVVGLIEAKARLHSRVVKAVTAGTRLLTQRRTEQTSNVALKHLLGSI